MACRFKSHQGHQRFRRAQQAGHLALDPATLNQCAQAAFASGNDQIQYRRTGTVQPHLFTHGSGRERMAWLGAGIFSGEMATCLGTSLPLAAIRRDDPNRIANWVKI